MRGIVVIRRKIDTNKNVPYTSSVKWYLNTFNKVMVYRQYLNLNLSLLEWVSGIIFIDIGINYLENDWKDHLGVQQGFFGTRDLPLFETGYREIGV